MLVGGAKGGSRPCTSGARHAHFPSGQPHVPASRQRRWYWVIPVSALQRREVRTRDSVARQTEGRRAGESESLNSSTVQKLAFGQRQHSGTGVELESSETRKRGASHKILVKKGIQFKLKIK